MTKEEAYKVLRLSEGASFERVVQAKNKMLSGGGVDADRTMQVISRMWQTSSTGACKKPEHSGVEIQ